MFYRVCKSCIISFAVLWLTFTEKRVMFLPASKSDCKIERDTTMKEWFLHYKEAIRVSLLALFRWTLLAVCTGVLCGGIGA